MATPKKPVAKKPAPKPVAKKPVVGKPAPKPVAKKPAPKPAAKPAPKPGSLAAIAQKAKASVPAAAKPAATPASSMPAYKTRSPQQAAKDLTVYVKDKNANLGKKGAPSAFISAAQRDMGKVAVDGIFGPKTKARAAELLGAKPAPVTTPAAIIAAASLAPPAPTAAVQEAKAAVVPSVAAAPKALPPEPEDSEDEDTSDTVYPPAVDPWAAQLAPTQAPATTLATMPAATRSEIADALRAFADQQEATKAEYDNLIDQLSRQFSVQLKGISDAVEMQMLQRQATTEHNTLVKNDDRWQKNNDVQQAIIDKLAELTKILLANDAVSRRVYAVYGVHL